MVSYEFPALSALAGNLTCLLVSTPTVCRYVCMYVVRMDGVGSKVHGEELSLYIRRKDVLAVLKVHTYMFIHAYIHTYITKTHIH